jgi:hypothetical protein
MLYMHQKPAAGKSSAALPAPPPHCLLRHLLPRLTVYRACTFTFLQTHSGLQLHKLSGKQ